MCSIGDGYELQARKIDRLLTAVAGFVLTGGFCIFI
jgi:hypothetical protein